MRTDRGGRATLGAVPPAAPIDATTTPPAAVDTTIHLCAAALDGRVDVRALGRTDAFDRAHDAVLAVETALPDGDRLLVFAVGAVVVFGRNRLDAPTVATIRERTGRDVLTATVETFEVSVDPRLRQPRVLWDGAVVPAATPEALLVVALVLAESVALERYEEAVEPLVEETAELARRLARKGRPPWRNAPVRRIAAISVQRLEIARWFFLLERPDVAWEDQVADRLYDALVDDLELRDRHAALERKLALIEHTLELVTTLWEGRRGRLLEGAIVVLIVVEIVLALAGSG
ncbi:MAG: RMD1 family protein [Deltaproteobacteria bacterium]|nr:MAG: RMD1 family protein [Deltaproteobacteria bacterium]